MMTNPIGGLTASNAAYNWMSAANARIGMLSFAGNPQAALRRDKQLQLNMLNSSLQYKAGLLMEETNKKIQKDNIERSFSIFA